MKNALQTLKIFNLSHPMISTEWPALLGDKYQDVLPFSWELVTDIKLAQVIVWDGMITPKSAPALRPIIEELKNTKILLLVGESMVSLRKNPMVELVDLDQIRYVELPGWSVLPEEILQAIELCQQKLTHV